MNINYDGIELSTIGFAIKGIDGRGLAEWKSEIVDIPGRSTVADLGSRFEPGTTVLTGTLSADTEVFALHTHTEWLNRLDVIKDTLNPKKGYRSLIITGDQVTRFRWARFASMSLQEERPVFKLPFQAVGIQFQNLEPYWRETGTPTVFSTVPTVLVNNGKDDTRPIFELTVLNTIVATKGARVEPVTLLAIDDFFINWKGSTAAGTLNPGDVLTVDSDSMIVTLLPYGTSAHVDVVRYYDYGGSGAYAGSGFPVIKRGGSTVTQIHPRIASVTARYDLLYL